MSDQVGSMPPVFFLRGWDAVVDSPALAFIEQVRRSGVDIVDAYLPPDGFSDLGEWASACIASVDAARVADQPLHLLAYCAGGNLCLEMVRQLEQRGDAPAYVGLIDVRSETAASRLRRGADARYLVPWGARLRLLLGRFAPPDRESVGSVLGSVAQRSARSVKELPQRGWRSRNHSRGPLFAVFRLLYGWEFGRIVTPVHCYNVQSSIDRFAPGDPSLNHASILCGGFLIRFIEGDHLTCIQPPHVEGLLALIGSDRVDRPTF